MSLGPLMIDLAGTEVLAEERVLQVLRCFWELPITMCRRKGDDHKGKAE